MMAFVYKVIQIHCNDFQLLVTQRTLSGLILFITEEVTYYLIAYRPGSDCNISPFTNTAIDRTVEGRI